MKLDLKDKRIFEYGVGSSTQWYASKGAKCYGVESNTDWHKAVTEAAPEAEIYLCEKAIDYPFYIANVKGEKYDIVIVDGIERDECINQAVDWVVPGGILIIDNWMQPSAYMPSKESQDLVLKFKHTIHPQPGHPDWKTIVAWT